MELVKPDIGLVFWMTITFLILLFILRKFAWKPILTMITDREASIANSLSEAANAREEMKSLKSQNEQILQEAVAEREKMLREAREMKEKMIAEAKTQAQDEGKKMIAQAKEAINMERDAAMRQIREQAVLLSIDAASKILKKELASAELQESLMSTYLNDVNAN
ncbi:MAG: F0F1 ATP synthase subunit B [Bacteroidetes bacterium]|nr:F0F1 ATP synthase subunit B [Bacteroidota bacterium]